MILSELADEYTIDGERTVLITEVTRMSGGRVCVAAIDVHSGDMVRPLQPLGANWEEDKWVNKGFMKVGNVLALRSAAQGKSDYPHATEDYRVAHVRLLGDVDTADLYAACVETADANIKEIFSDEVEDNKYVEAKTECRSLGCVIVPKNRLNLSVSYGKVHVNMRFSAFDWYSPSVTELGLKAISADDAKEVLKDRIAAAVEPVAVRLGLARAWAGTDGSYNPKRCYLQVNGIICA